MKISDLKGLKKDDKLRFLQSINIEDLDDEILNKLSNDAAIDVRLQIARKCPSSEILLNMMFNKKNWKPHIISEIYMNKAFTIKNKIEFIKSKEWKDEAFPFNQVKFDLIRDLNNPGSNDGFIDLIITFLEEDPEGTPINFVRSAIYGTSKDILLKLINLTMMKKDNYLNLFLGHSHVMNLLSIKELRELFNKYIDNSLAFIHFESTFYRSIINDKIFGKLLKNSDYIGQNSFSLISLDSKIAFFNNPDISQYIYDNILGEYIDADIKLRMAIGSKKYSEIIRYIKLTNETNKKVINFALELKKLDDDLANTIWFSYISNETAIFKLVKENLKFFNNVARNLAFLSDNKAFKDDEVNELIDKAINDADNPTEKTLSLFKHMLINGETPRNDLINKVWNIIKDTKVEREDSVNSDDSIINIFKRFFNTYATKNSYGQKAKVPKEIQIEKALEYYMKFMIPDWLIYSDDLPEELWEEVLDHPKLKDLIVEPHSSDFFISLKEQILTGKYQANFGMKYYEQTGYDEYIPEEIKNIFLF